MMAFDNYTKKSIFISIVNRFEDRIASRVINSLKPKNKEQLEQQKRLRETVENAVSHILNHKLITASSSLPVAPSTSSTDVQSKTHSLLRRQSVLQQQGQILKLLQEGDINAAFNFVSLTRA